MITYLSFPYAKNTSSSSKNWWRAVTGVPACVNTFRTQPVSSFMQSVIAARACSKVGLLRLFSNSLHTCPNTTNVTKCRMIIMCQMLWVVTQGPLPCIFLQYYGKALNVPEREIKYLHVNRLRLVKRNCAAVETCARSSVTFLPDQLHYTSNASPVNLLFTSR